jgi:hypothetical protein
VKVLAILSAAAALGVAAPVKATLTAPSHTPKINVKWYYVVHVTRNGKPVAGKLTVQIVDPIGGVHPVEFGPTTKNIVRWPITGSFRDYIIWPRSSVGYPVKLRATVVGTGYRKVVSYTVTPHT